MNDRETIPRLSRFAALKGDWNVCPHDDHAGHYELCGSIPAEGDWEWVEPENEAHMVLRATAIQRVPQMLVQLQETYDLLLDMDDRGEIDVPGYSPGYSPDCAGEDTVPDRTGNRLRTLMQCIGMTLEEIEQHGVELGLGTPPDAQTTGPEEARGE